MPSILNEGTRKEGIWTEGDEIVCLCRIGAEAIESNRWFLNGDVYSCPLHKPLKQFCKYHHNGFYGNCSACALYDAKQLQKEIVRLLTLLVNNSAPYHTGSQTVHLETGLDVVEPEPDTA